MCDYIIDLDQNIARKYFGLVYGSKTNYKSYNYVIVPLVDISDIIDTIKMLEYYNYYGTIVKSTIYDNSKIYNIEDTDTNKILETNESFVFYFNNEEDAFYFNLKYC